MSIATNIIWPVRSAVYRLAKELLYRTPLKKRIFHFYQHTYMYEPDQLLFLCQCIEQVKDVPGAFMEIGCAKGHTTVFLNRFMDRLGMERKYFAIDTFSGFTESDIRYETKQRNKSHHYGDFRVNDKKWFDHTMKMNAIGRVESWKGDAKNFDFSQAGPIAFCLLDVDLYEPTRDILPRVYERLAPGGIIVIDDCKVDSKWDGALYAYQEFVSKRGLQENILCDKLGFIKK